jgi:hypothetical protein
VEVLAMEKMEKMGEYFCREVRGVWKPLMMRLEDIEIPHRNQNYLR